MQPRWPIETDRLRLRPFEAADLESLHRIYSDEGVARFLYADARTLEQTRELLDRKLGPRLDAEGDWLSAAVVGRDTGELVGDMALNWVSEQHRTGEIGFVVAPACQGRGYAAEAARPFLDFAFRTMGLHRVIARAEARNAASVRVLEKLGMRHEGLFVENEWVKNEWQSEVFFAILESEWRRDL